MQLRAEAVPRSTARAMPGQVGLGLLLAAGPSRRALHDRMSLTAVASARGDRHIYRA
ncbi:hypothetical protein QCN29_09510 [Streptomyces sp. HNM0663]|uniref:Uncharacterized protein n=1 Tax=Streptomyces chengmaiensis TaxID=3040919 RepID=A0ABT6HJU5_9ACTN|nr:hypothetical protein [Streptomyces chengmaiensis]MDH2389023.1 hypothetical protein [Streptomyces chengmaiensis]